ncbi:MAG: acyl-CoA dehydrogenase family protein [Planctomycetota bacterium]|jgi:glutaryl-CoA dehydrogenase
MKKFQGTDFVRFDSLLEEDEVMVRDSIREWVEDNVIPAVDRHFQEDEFHIPWKEPLAELGVFGATIDGYGGGGLSSVAAGLMYQELERGDSGLRSFVSVMNGLVIHPIFTYGDEGHRERWLPALIRGEKIGCFGVTEPDYGSNPGGMQTRADKVKGGFLLNGTKRWITNGSIADVAVVFARTKAGIRAFLVEGGSEGLSAPLIDEKWSLRASVTSELILEDCFVPNENLLPGSEIGLKAALECLNQARHSIAWGAIGTMMACYEEGLEYTLTRKQFADKPLAGHQLVQRKLSGMLTEISKAQLLTLRVARMKDEGTATHAHISMIKRDNCYWALEIARTVRDMLGASGITHEYQVGRHLLNFESVKTYEGTHDIHHLILGEHITGIPAYE